MVLLAQLLQACLNSREWPDAAVGFGNVLHRLRYQPPEWGCTASPTTAWRRYLFVRGGADSAAVDAFHAAAVKAGGVNRMRAGAAQQISPDDTTRPSSAIPTAIASRR